MCCIDWLPGNVKKHISLFLSLMDVFFFFLPFTQLPISLIKKHRHFDLLRRSDLFSRREQSRYETRSAQTQELSLDCAAWSIGRTKLVSLQETKIIRKEGRFRGLHCAHTAGELCFCTFQT